MQGETGIEETIPSQTQTGGEPYEHAVIRTLLANPVSLQNHNVIHTGEKPNKCDLCDKQFAQTRSLMNHLMTHSKDMGESFQDYS